MSTLIGGNTNDIIQSAVINNALLSKKNAAAQKSLFTTPNLIINDASTSLNPNASIQVSITNLQGLSHNLGLYNSKGLIPVSSANKADQEVNSKLNYVIQSLNSQAQAESKFTKNTIVNGAFVASGGNVQVDISTTSSKSNSSSNSNSNSDNFKAGLNPVLGSGNVIKGSDLKALANNKILNEGAIQKSLFANLQTAGSDLTQSIRTELSNSTSVQESQTTNNFYNIKFDLNQYAQRNVEKNANTVKIQNNSDKARATVVQNQSLQNEIDNPIKAIDFSKGKQFVVKNNATISNLALNAQNELNSFHNTTDAMIKEAVHAPNKLGTISE